jgi:LacI family transcriptional regulator
MRSPTKNVTIHDVAKHAGVSVGTVSRVLSKNESVKLPILLRVQQSIAALNYKPNLAARALRSNRVDIIGVIVPDITNPFFAQVAQDIETAASRHGYAVMLATSHNDTTIEARQMSAIVDRSPAGIVLVPAADHQDFTMPTNVQVVAFDRTIGGIRGIYADQYQGAALAAQYLFDLGHRRIDYIGGSLQTRVAQLREDGFTTRLRQLCADDPTMHLQVHHGLFDYASGEKIAREILSRPLDQRPTAIAAASDQQAIGALRAARDLRIDVPGELTIVGFDDITLADLVVPRLTTVRQPATEMAEEAVRLLLAGPDAEARPDFPCELVIRTSAAPPKIRQSGSPSI